MFIFETLQQAMAVIKNGFIAVGASLNHFSGVPLDSDNFVFSALGKIVDFTGIITDLLANLVDGVKQVLTVSAEVAVSVGHYVTFLPQSIQNSCVALLSLIIALCVVRWIT